MRLVLLAAALAWVGAWAELPQIEIAPAEPNAYTHLNVKNNPRDFQFAIISDRTGGQRAGKFQEGIAKINLLKPELVMSVGDGIEGYTEDLAAMDSQWDELDGIMAESEAPFFYVPGNHDISNEHMLEAWKARYGSPYYFFVYQDVLFVILNSEDPPPKQLSDEQLAYVEDVLAKHSDVRWTLFFMHVPLWQLDHPTNWDKLEALVKDRKYTVFAGHTHDYMKTERQGRRYIILATTGGGSQLMGPAHGQFDQVAWVTMTDDGPVLANLFLNGIWNENVRTPEVAELIRPLEQGLAVYSTPLLVDQELFARGECTLTLTNPADRPMTIEAWIQTQANLIVSPTHIKLEIAAKSSETVALAVQLTGPAGLESFGSHGGQMFPPDWVRAPWYSLAGPQIDYTITYAVDDREPVEYANRHQIMFDGPNPCETIEAAVDGDLGEWATLSNACTNPAQIDQALHSWHGPADSSFRFATCHDADFVYIAVQVTDDDLLFRDREEASRKDGVELRLDARPSAARAASPAAIATDPIDSPDLVFLGVSLGEGGNATTVYKADKLPEGTQAKAAKVDGGYVVEVAVPVAYLNEKQGADWTDFRLNVTVHDFDSGYSYPRVALWWRPEWSGPGNYAESGVFVRR